jgi:hypothetical protein
LVAASDLVGVNHLRSIGFGVPECLFGDSMFIVGRGYLWLTPAEAFKENRDDF